mgnify:CR=1 FL=1
METFSSSTISSNLFLSSPSTFTLTERDETLNKCVGILVLLEQILLLIDLDHHQARLGQALHQLLGLVSQDITQVSIHIVVPHAPLHSRQIHISRDILALVVTFWVEEFGQINLK